MVQNDGVDRRSSITGSLNNKSIRVFRWAREGWGRQVNPAAVTKIGGWPTTGGRNPGIGMGPVTGTGREPAAALSRGGAVWAAARTVRDHRTRTQRVAAEAGRSARRKACLDGKALARARWNRCGRSCANASDKSAGPSAGLNAPVQGSACTPDSGGTRACQRSGANAYASSFSC